MTRPGKTLSSFGTQRSWVRIPSPRYPLGATGNVDFIGVSGSFLSLQRQEEFLCRTLPSLCALFHLFFEPEHSVPLIRAFFLCSFRIMGITMFYIKKVKLSSEIKKSSKTKGFLSHLFRAHSTSYLTGGLQSYSPAIPYATAYCPPMTDIIFALIL